MASLPPITNNPDVRYLGRVLGDVIRAYGGEKLYERTEVDGEVALSVEDSILDRWRVEKHLPQRVDAILCLPPVDERARAHGGPRFFCFKSRRWLVQFGCNQHAPKQRACFGNHTGVCRGR